MSRADCTISRIRRKRQRLDVYKFDPRLSRVYLSELDEVPDSVRNLPLECQRAYAWTFNNNLRAYGLVDVAMRAGNRAARTKLAQLKQRALKIGQSFDAYIHLQEKHKGRVRVTEAFNPPAIEGVHNAGTGSHGKLHSDSRRGPREICRGLHADRLVVRG